MSVASVSSDVCARLTNLRATSTGWAADCPLHGGNGRSPGLTLAMARDGRTHAYCWGGCSGEALAAALGSRVVIDNARRDRSEKARP